jgi:hypothetical protein
MHLLPDLDALQALPELRARLASNQLNRVFIHGDLRVLLSRD